LTFDEVFAWVRDALHASLAGEKREHEAAIGWLRAEYESAHCEQMLSALPPKPDIDRCSEHVRLVQIVLQKSKVAGLGIFRENPIREPIADSYALNRVTEVVCAFNVKAMRSPTFLHESRAYDPQKF
jgi:hypothetical protein